jgi:ABC-type molybdate transport system substrate-binding protein
MYLARLCLSDLRSASASSSCSRLSRPASSRRDALEKGEAFGIFASAALPHAQSLSQEAISGPSVLFVRNALCALVPAGADVSAATLVDFLLAPQTRLATSTPKSDPGGDYTWQLFGLIEKTHAGAYAALTGKAQQVFGGRRRPIP